MTDEPTLFDLPEDKTHKFEPEPISRQEQLRKQSKRNDPETSKEAVKKVNLKGHREYVKSLFREHAGIRGLTDFELENLSKLRPGGAQKRRSDLSRDGELICYGETRPTDSGSQAQVWHLK